jgi:hypothetical protein
MPTCWTRCNHIRQQRAFFLLVTIEPLHRHTTGDSSSFLIGGRFASIALIRRPYPAGYFVFSDLAVRTAGQYYLKFSLFKKSTSPGSNGRYFTSPYIFDSTRLEAEPQRSPQVLRFCLEVNSLPFIVFRPRSFPGILNCTPLSQSLAEQGCRIRLRGPHSSIRARRRKQTNMPCKALDHLQHVPSRDGDGKFIDAYVGIFQPFKDMVRILIFSKTLENVHALVIWEVIGSCVPGRCFFSQV